MDEDDHNLPDLNIYCVFFVNHKLEKNFIPAVSNKPNV